MKILTYVLTGLFVIILGLVTGLVFMGYGWCVIAFTLFCLAYLVIRFNHVPKLGDKVLVTTGDNKGKIGEVVTIFRADTTYAGILYWTSKVIIVEFSDKKSGDTLLVGEYRKVDNTYG